MKDFENHIEDEEQNRVERFSETLNALTPEQYEDYLLEMIGKENYKNFQYYQADDTKGRDFLSTFCKMNNLNLESEGTLIALRENGISVADYLRKNSRPETEGGRNHAYFCNRELESYRTNPKYLTKAENALLKLGFRN